MAPPPPPEHRDGGQYATLVKNANTDPVVMALATADGTCELCITQVPVRAVRDPGDGGRVEA